MCQFYEDLWQARQQAVSNYYDKYCDVVNTQEALEKAQLALKAANAVANAVQAAWLKEAAADPERAELVSGICISDFRPSVDVICC